MQPARHCISALLVFACLLFAELALDFLLFLWFVWGVSALSRMVKGSPVSIPEIEAELSRLARVSR